MLQLGRLASLEADLSCQKSLPAHLVFHQRLAHWPEQFQWALRCNRSKSSTLLKVRQNPCCYPPCNMQWVPECQALSPVRMLSSEMLKMWTNREATAHRLGW